MSGFMGFSRFKRSIVGKKVLHSAPLWILSHYFCDSMRTSFCSSFITIEIGISIYTIHHRIPLLLILVQMRTNLDLIDVGSVTIHRSDFGNYGFYTNIGRFLLRLYLLFIRTFTFQLLPSTLLGVHTNCIRVFFGPRGFPFYSLV